MLFNSLEYIFFFLIAIVVHYSLPKQWRWVFLLGASYYFYMCWKVEYIALIILSTMVDYWAGLQMGKQKEKRKRKKFLYASLTVNLGLLFFFKYYDFFTDNVEVAFSQFNLFYEFPHFDLLLPVGISFYTFQTLSYSIDVYRGEIEPERHLGYFALYVTYFPQLVAGPIERADSLIPQLKTEAKVTNEDVRYAINKILLGFFKKVVVADTAAVYVNHIYGNIDGSTGIQMYIAMIAFGVQLFGDFSGYSDIAIGTARLFGVRLMENFNKPYWVQNIREFWARWHISLSHWIRDYMYRPLLDVKKSIRNNDLYRGMVTIVVFVAIGIWHGADWTFVYYGALQGGVMIIQRFTTPLMKPWKENRIYRWWNAWFQLQIIILGTAFFRGQTIDDSWLIMEKLFTDFRLDIGELFMLYRFELFLSFLVGWICFSTQYFNKELRFKYNWLYILTALGLIMLFGRDSSEQFIYFQF